MSKKIEQAFKKALSEQGVSNEWMKSHLIIESLDLDKPKKRKNKNVKNKKR